MAVSKPFRSAGFVLVFALVCGFGYSGLAVVRGYLDILHTAASKGPSATVDQYLVTLGLSSLAQLREAVTHAAWDRDAQVMVAPSSSLSRQELVSAYYVASYALYPRRVVLAGSTDPKAEARSLGVRHIIFVGLADRSHLPETERISQRLTLVSLQ